MIALATAVALSHDMFDGALYLGVCDKIVPGLVMAALSFGHLPAIFVPGGPMTTGLSNGEKSRIRQLYAEGKVGRKELLEAESASYHGPGTCTFYGTANTNQMLMEIMGLHLPGASFVNPNTPLRDALTTSAAKRVTEITALGNEYTPVGEVVDERAVVNGVVGLHATGGSTNHTLHLVAMARAAGIQLSWDDFADLSEVVPLLVPHLPERPRRREPLPRRRRHGLPDRRAARCRSAARGRAHRGRRGRAGALPRRAVPRRRRSWSGGPAPRQTLDAHVLAPIAKPFSANGGLKLLDGNLGRAVIKISAVKPDRHVIEAPALVFHDQNELHRRLQARRAEPRLRRRGPLPGAEGQRHAGAAQADPGPGRAAGQGLQGGAGHRRADVGRLGQGAGGDPSHARSRRMAARSPGCARAT